MALSWQEVLYPLGFISSVFFTLRVLYQWALAEVTRSSPSPKGFWFLSIGGNISHMIHSIIQMQLPVALVQAINLVISHRNLNLLRKPAYQYSLTRVWIHFALVIALTFGAFFWMCHLTGQTTWMRTPSIPTPAWWIQALGLAGIFLYGTRFWIQWILTEKKRESHFGSAFWIVSLIGAILSSIYFIIILDWVNILGTCFTLIPYARNLFFIKRRKAYE